MGSGRCVTHNCKLNRIVKEKRVSCIDKNGKISWTMREGAVLLCPKAGSSTSKEGQNTAIDDQLRVGNTSTNKKLRIYSDGNEPIRLEAQVDSTNDNNLAAGLV